MRRLTAILVTIVLSVSLGARGKIILPRPPEGWEMEVTPGFDPSIESVVVHSKGCRVFCTSFKEQLERWGPEAIPVIIRINEAPKWEPLRYVTIQMLAESPEAEAERYLIGRFEALTAKQGPDESEAKEMRYLCENLLAHGPARFRDLLLEEAREGNVAYAGQYAPAMVEMGTKDAHSALMVLRRRLPHSPAETIRSHLVHIEGILRGQESLGAVAQGDEQRGRRKDPALRSRIEALRTERLHEYDIACLVGDLVEAEGEKAIKFLGGVAADSDMPMDARRQAVVGLGLIGTEKAAAAYARLRQTAREKDWAPKPKEQYTHAERIAEATAMTLYVIPDKCPPRGGAVPSDLTMKSTWVSEDYASATTRWGTYSVKARRVGEEWLVSEALPMPIP